MTKEEIKQYIEDNLRLEWNYRKGEYYLTLKLDDEKISEVSFGEGY